MHPYRPPFGGPARPTNPNTTQPQTPYNLQDMDPSFLSYAAYLSGAPPFVSPTYGFGQAGGSQPSQPEPESEPDVEVVPESQPEPVQDKSKRGRRSHKKKEKDEPRRAKTTIKWTKDEEYTLTRAWLDISEDEDTGKLFFFLFFFSVFLYSVFFSVFFFYFIYSVFFFEIMKDRVVETKKFNELQEARQMEKDIEFLSKPIDHLQGDALILAQMRRQKIREKYGL
ncbi:hypothetical protein HanHA300_Chr05g0176701 [Helianthus annuus]|nr:hypothetical protein HanHA300_Chr05g0176701 [Helianthus annuus]